MKILKLLFQKIFLFILLINAISSFGQENIAKKQTFLLKKVLEKNHFQPRVLNDEMSAQVFHRFINLLDPRQLYFTEAEIQKLSAYKFNIDDELNGKSFQFLPLAISLYKQSLLNAEKTFTGILQKPMSFSEKEKIYFDSSDSLDFAKNNQEHEKRWNKWLKYQVLWQWYKMENEESLKNKTLSAAKEQEIREKVKTIEKRAIKRILENAKGYENYITSLFFNAISYCYDPHTNFFTEADMENFKSEMSKDGYSFGLDLEEDDKGDVIISRLVPGGPAWKSNVLHKGDILVKLKWASKEAVDLTGADLEEVKAFLEMSNKEQLEITVKKTSGLTKSVVLMKEKLREDDNIVKSYILNGQKKIGYISLPGFYTEWENLTGLGCANDVAKEIAKLQKEQIDGLILDIRYNGGGSLMEGMDLGGLFINEGPLLMMLGSDRKPIVMKDMNRGTIYDGPLAVMVNGQSASASEVLAGALQDYKRAVIVGSPTFGKATGQVIMPLDTTLNLKSSKPGKTSLGYLSVTVNKLYRITGKSIQLKGVIPDIYFPDIYENLEFKEAAYPFALPFDSIYKKVFYSPLAGVPLNELASKSKLRVASSSGFKHVNTISDSLKYSLEGLKEIPLNMIDFHKNMTKSFSLWKSLGDAEKKESTLFRVENTTYDKDLMHVDTYAKEINESLVKNIHSDIYVEETFQIISDLINLTQK